MTPTFDGLQICTMCRTIKLSEDFYRRRSGYPEHICKVCKNRRRIENLRLSDQLRQCSVCDRILLARNLRRHIDTQHGTASG